MPKPYHDGFPRSARLGDRAVRQARRAAALCRPPYPDMDSRIHDSRKRAKKLRSLLRMAAPACPGAVRQCDRRIAAAARDLGKTRDSAARLECLDRLIARTDDTQDKADLRLLRGILADRTRGHAHAVDGARALKGFRRAMERTEKALRAWPSGAFGPGTVRRGLLAGYRDTRTAWKQARAAPDADHLHDWRKALQTHRHQMRLLAPAPGTRHARRCDRLDGLADLLGDGHDLAMLEDYIHRDRTALPRRAVSAAVRASRHQSARLHAEAFAVGKTLFRRKPKAFLRQTTASL